MLEVRPSCENCSKPLPADSVDARICSYECTFCADCVDTILSNVCPNCGGGFVPRPVRPLNEWRAGVSRVHQRPSSKTVSKPVKAAEHVEFVANLKNILPENR